MHSLKNILSLQTDGQVHFLALVVNVLEPVGYNISYSTVYISFCSEQQLHANNIKCVIELKYTNGINSNDTSKIDGLIKIIKDNQMIDQVFILTSMKNCLLYIKEKYPLMNLVLLTGEKTTNMENVNWWST